MRRLTIAILFSLVHLWGVACGGRGGGEGGRAAGGAEKAASKSGGSSAAADTRGFSAEE